MVENITQQNLALIWGTLRNNVNFSILDIPAEIKLVGSILGEFPVYSYQKIYLEIPKNQKKQDLSGRGNNNLNFSKKNLWISQRIIQLPLYTTENEDYDLLEEKFKILITNWNNSHVPNEIPCIVLALKVIGNYCNEREAQFARIFFIWENKTAQFLDLEYFEGPIEDCISPEWYITAFEWTSMKKNILKFKNLQNYLPNWNNKTYSLFIIPSFLTNFLNIGEKGYYFENGWGNEYNYQSKEDLLLDLNVILDKINTFF
jgi:hypothetical protein